MNKQITSYKELQLTIRELNVSKAEKEALIKQNVSSIKESLKPVNIIRSALKHMAHDKEAQYGALSALINAGAEFILNKWFKKEKSSGGFVTSLLEKVLAGFKK